MFELPPKETLTLLIAAYAAVVSTFVLGWDAYKWLSQGPKVRTIAQMGMRIIGGNQVENKTYVSVIAVNYEDRATTITNMGFLYYTSWIKAYLWRRNANKSFVVTSPSQTQAIPYRFEAGEQWIGLADQDEEIEKMADEGYLFVIVFCSTIGKGVRVRIPPKNVLASKKNPAKLR